MLALAAIAAYACSVPTGTARSTATSASRSTVVATVVLIHTGYSNPGGPVHRLLGHPWLATVGRYSYSLYLWHIVPFLLLEERSARCRSPVLGLVAVTRGDRC